MRPSKQRLSRHLRRKYPKKPFPRLQETKDALLAMRADTEYVCEICGEELNEYDQCYTCSGAHHD